METIYFAKWILLESGELLTNGAISISENRICSVGPRSKVRRGSRERIVNLGDSMVLPGLINMHTHLEDSVLRGTQKDPDETFTTWDIKNHARVRQASPEAVKTSIKLKIRELLAQGITTVVDNSRLGYSYDVLKNESIRSVIINELTIDDPAAESQSLEKFLSTLPQATSKVEIGLGPHGIYSLSKTAHQRILSHIKQNDLLWTVHIAESAEELHAFSEKRGDLYFQITRKQPWPFDDASIGSMNYALQNELIPDQGICIHCNYVNGTELECLADKNVSIVICHSYTQELGHKAFPLDVARNRNILICLGTEGVAAPGITTLFDELFSLKNAYPHISAAEMLKWVTINPAIALKMQDQLGSLSPGKLADIIAVRFTYDPLKDPIEELLMSEPEITAVIINGEEIVTNY
ncbi:MAG TPA: amidohydrolase family protein [Chitinispirillaceae bacterium]|nr:amidohydrolase family protein [Chitinispirillaceae bacterium]